MQISLKSESEVVDIIHTHDAGKDGIMNILWGEDTFPDEHRHLLGKTIDVVPTTVGAMQRYRVQLGKGKNLNIHPAWVYKGHEYHDMIGRGIWLQANMAINICARSRKKVGTADLCSMISVYVVFGGDLTTKESVVAKSFTGEEDASVPLTARESVQLQKIEEYIIDVFTTYYNHPSNKGVTRHDNKNGFKFS